MIVPTQLASLVQAAGTVGEVAALTALCVLGVALTVIRLPGTWLIVATAAGYGWYGDWQAISLLTVGVLIGIAVVGEVGEFLTSMLTAKNAGASKRAMWGAFIGGFAGMFIFTIPLPLVGTIIGAVVGCFLGAVIGELTAHDDVGKGVRVGRAAAIGYVLGMAFKIAIAFLMAGLLLGNAVVAALDSSSEAPQQPSRISDPGPLDVALSPPVGYARLGAKCGTVSGAKPWEHDLEAGYQFVPFAQSRLIPRPSSSTPNGRREAPRILLQYT